MPSTIRGALPRLPQLVVEDLDVRRRTLSLMRDLCIRPEVRNAIDALGQRERRNQWLRTDGRRGVELAAQDIALLLSAGATRAEVMLVPVLLEALIEELCHEGAGGDLASVTLEHMRLDAEEDASQGLALVHPLTPEAMDDRAAQLYRESASARAEARMLERMARKRRLGLMARTA